MARQKSGRPEGEAIDVPEKIVSRLKREWTDGTDVQRENIRRTADLSDSQINRIATRKSLQCSPETLRKLAETFPDENVLHPDLRGLLPDEAEMVMIVRQLARVGVDQVKKALEAVRPIHRTALKVLRADDEARITAIAAELLRNKLSPPEDKKPRNSK